MVFFENNVGCYRFLVAGRRRRVKNLFEKYFNSFAQRTRSPQRIEEITLRHFASLREKKTHHLNDSFKGLQPHEGSWSGSTYQQFHQRTRIKSKAGR